MKPTPFMIRVLNEIHLASEENRFTSPAWIAHDVFPRDHPGWQRSCKCGRNGTTQGSGLVMMIGGYLGKLAKAGLVTRFRDCNRLTCDGFAMLKDHADLLEA